MLVKERILKEIQKGVARIFPGSTAVISVDYPPHMHFGQYSSNVSMLLAREQKKAPMEIAQQLSQQLSMSMCEAVTVVAPGFLNFKLKESFLKKVPREILSKKFHWSESESGKKKKVSVEFISANPTGPLTLANGRGGFFGDVMCNVFTKTGYKVSREYYVNDAGNQVNILAESVLRKYFKKQGIPMDFPDYCYQGDYIDDLASKLRIPNYNLAKTNFQEIRDRIKDRLVGMMLQQIKSSIEKKMHIHFDLFFSEKSLYEKNGPVDKMWKLLQEKDLLYEKDGATWLKTSQFGDEKDRVLKKKDGELTYFLPDIAYRYNRLVTRKADIAMTVLGADHHGYIARMEAAMKMIGLGGRLRDIIMQFIRLIRDGQEVKMSKRKGTYVTTEEVIDEVGIDAVRYFFLAHAANSHMDFDPMLAKERSDKNPVYYVQYAHARMCSIVHKVRSEKRKVIQNKQLAETSQRLISLVLRWPELLDECSKTYELHRIPQFAYEVARAFHDFYDSERVITTEGKVNGRQLEIIEATRIIFQDMLKIMGISAPEKM